MKSKQFKRQEAEERQKKCNNLSFEERLGLTATRPGKSKKETIRLLKYLRWIKTRIE